MRIRSLVVQELDVAQKCQWCRPIQQKVRGAGKRGRQEREGNPVEYSRILSSSQPTPPV